MRAARHPRRTVALALAIALGLGLLAAPFAAEAQPPGKVPRVGVLSPGYPPPDDPFHQRENF